MEDRLHKAHPLRDTKECPLLDPASHLRRAIATLEALHDPAPTLPSRTLPMTQRDELLAIVGCHFDVPFAALADPSPSQPEVTSNPEPFPQGKRIPLPRSPSLTQRDELLALVDHHFEDPATPRHVLILEGFMVHDAQKARVYPRLLIPFSIHEAPREVAHLLYDQLIFNGTKAVRVPYPPWGASPTPYLLSPTREEAKFIYTT